MPAPPAARAAALLGLLAALLLAAALPRRAAAQATPLLCDAAFGSLNFDYTTATKTDGSAAAPQSWGKLLGHVVVFKAVATTVDCDGTLTTLDATVETSALSGSAAVIKCARGGRGRAPPRAPAAWGPARASVRGAPDCARRTLSPLPAATSLAHRRPALALSLTGSSRCVQRRVRAACAAHACGKGARAGRPPVMGAALLPPGGRPQPTTPANTHTPSQTQVDITTPSNGAFAEFTFRFFKAPYTSASQQVVLRNVRVTSLDIDNLQCARGARANACDSWGLAIARVAEARAGAAGALRCDACGWRRRTHH